MQRVDVVKISYYPPNKGYAVILKEIDGKRQIPIIVGTNEAQSIAMAIEGIEMPRPMTHDLIIDMLHSLDIDIKHVVISNVKSGTFFAKIVLEKSIDRQFEIDSRPSDAIAVGLRSMSPVYVEEIIFDYMNTDEKNDNAKNKDEKLIKDITRITEPLTSSENMLDNLNEALNRAIQDEEYEVAAKLRDRIREIKKEIKN